MRHSHAPTVHHGLLGCSRGVTPGESRRSPVCPRPAAFHANERSDRDPSPRPSGGCGARNVPGAAPEESWHRRRRHVGRRSLLSPAILLEKAAHMQLLARQYGAIEWTPDTEALQKASTYLSSRGVPADVGLFSTQAGGDENGRRAAAPGVLSGLPSSPGVAYL